MSELLLHHYDFSNYSEKARAMLGFKGLSWRSVVMPSIEPKPNLKALTGGYRRAPVLQIGADVYCDTRLIARELERRFPSPPLFPQSCAVEARMISHWAETQFFRPVMLYAWGTNQDVMEPGLAADRAKMRGLPMPSRESVAFAAKRSAPLVRLQLAWIEELLSDHRAFVCGIEPSIADFSIYHAIWFLTDRSDRLAFELEPFRGIARWMETMRGFGHGTHTPLSDRDALQIAERATPETLRPSQPYPEDPVLGSHIRMRADDYAQDPMDGELVFCDAEEIAFRRVAPELGEVVVHVPRLGFEMRPR